MSPARPLRRGNEVHCLDLLAGHVSAAAPPHGGDVADLRSAAWLGRGARWLSLLGALLGIGVLAFAASSLTGRIPEVKAATFWVRLVRCVPLGGEDASADVCECRPSVTCDLGSVMSGRRRAGCTVRPKDGKEESLWLARISSSVT